MRRSDQSWEERAAMQRAAIIVLAGLAVAIATGLAHTALVDVTLLATGRPTWFPRAFFWMSPVAYGLVLLPGVVVLAGLVAAVRRRWALQLSLAALVTTGVFGLLLPYTQISRAAALVLALGIGVQAGRMLAHRANGLVLWSRRFVATALVILPILGWAQYRRLHAAPQPYVGTGNPPPPNVLLIIMDDVRAKNVTLNAPAVPTTPGLLRHAADGVVFDHAYSAAPWSLPSHASIFTGLYARQQDGDWTRALQADVRTLAEVLGERGYATAGFVANLHYATWDSGLAQGFGHYEDFPTDWLQILRCSSYTQTAAFTQLLDARSLHDVASVLLHPNLSMILQHTYRVKLADRIGADFQRWQSRVGERPFFAFLNVMDAHLPYLEPEPIHSRYPAAERDVRSYDSAIQFIDAQVDSILARLERQGVLDRTIVVVTADHGDLFDEHGLAGHNSLYLDVLHVPLLIRYPAAVPRGVRVEHPVTLRDLAATLLDLSIGEAVLPGSSLRHAWEGRPDLLSPVLAEVRRQPNPLHDNPASHGAMRSLFDDSLHYIVNEGTGREELYAFRSDSLELSDLAQGDSTEARLRPWRERLARVLCETRAPATVPP